MPPAGHRPQRGTGAERRRHARPEGRDASGMA
ncbi:Uncharacterised protein [Bordetella pertussis]|nr:Uncharacterised protein [Bordetella pertussis]